MRTDDGAARFRGWIEQQSDERIERKRREKIDMRERGDRGRQKESERDEGNMRCGDCAVRTKKRVEEKKREREGRAMEKTERRNKRK